MPIPESQLNTWAKQGPTATPRSTYERVRVALDSAPRLRGRVKEIFLQGSYRNDTNVHGDSDVDVVIRLDETLVGDTSQLPPLQALQEAYSFVPARYTYEQFRQDVHLALKDAFPRHNIVQGGKSIKVPREACGTPADVVPCIVHRRYKWFLGGLYGHDAVNGIWLRDYKVGSVVVNYPKQHYDTGVLLSVLTGSWYKPTIRMFKNAFGWLVDAKVVNDDLASSYFIECLMSNVPVNNFGTSYQDTFRNVVNWLRTANKTAFTCQNRQQTLFTDGGWTIAKADTLITWCIWLWNHWYSHERVRI